MSIPELRDWQKLALAAWEESDYRGCFQVATGGGKTTFALAAFEALLTVEPSTRCVVIVPTTALLDQWYVAFQEDAGVSASDIKVLKSRDLEPTALVNLVIINTARGFSGVSFANEILLIVDECHRAGSPINARALAPGAGATIGLSATPFRDFADGFEQYIEPRLGPVLVSYSLENAIEDGVLSPLRLTYVKVPLLPNEQDEYDRLSKRVALAYSDGDQELVEQLLRRRARVYNSAYYRLPVARAILDEHRGKRSLVFFESIALAQAAVEQLDAAGHSVVIYHSQMSPQLRRSNLRAFRRGVFDILVACRALDEGFNVPEAQLALIAAGTASRRQRVQRFGRVLRSMAGKALAEVISIYATPVEEERFIQEADGLEGTAHVRWREARLD